MQPIVLLIVLLCIVFYSLLSALRVWLICKFKFDAQGCDMVEVCRAIFRTIGPAKLHAHFPNLGDVRMTFQRFCESGTTPWRLTFKWTAVPGRRVQSLEVLVRGKSSHPDTCRKIEESSNLSWRDRMEQGFIEL